MTAEPAVSVLTTCYNRAAYLRQAIESVLSSDFTDFEYIIVDDCSSDGSADIAREYAKADSRVKAYANERNRGDYPNRNRAAALARGRYLKYVDSDDIIYPPGLRVMMECMRFYPAAGLGVSRPPTGDRPYPVCLDPGQAYRRHFFGGGLLSNAPLSAIIRRDSFETVGGFSGKRYVGDTELWLSLARSCGVVLMPAGLTWWRSHGDQEFAAGHGTFGYAEFDFEVQRAALLHQDCPMSRDEAASALSAARLRHAKVLLGIARRGHWREAAGIAKRSGVGIRDFGQAIASRIAEGGRSGIPGARARAQTS